MFDESPDAVGDVDARGAGERLPAGHGVDFDGVAVGRRARQQVDSGDAGADRVGGAAPWRSATRRRLNASPVAPRLTLVRQSSGLRRRMPNVSSPMTSNRRS